MAAIQNIAPSADMLNAALAWSGRGFRVFPLRPSTKEPYGGLDWVNSATADPDAVRRMWTDPATGLAQPHNVGVLTSDPIVIDVDVKGGKKGLESLFDLDIPMDTLTTRTPSGGLHLYFKGPNRANGVNRLGDGLDMRSWHG
jgi:hypothetical protein